VIKILENGECIIIHNYTMGDARFIFELFQIIHYYINILLNHYASFISPRLCCKFYSFDCHSIIFLIFQLNRIWAFLNVTRFC